MRDFIIEYMPPVRFRLLAYFLHSRLFFRSSGVSTIIKRIVNDDTDNINLISTIIASECIERVVQQRKPDGCEKLRFDGDKDVARGVVCNLSEYRLGRGTIYDDKVFVLKLIGDKVRQNSWVSPN